MADFYQEQFDIACKLANRHRRDGRGFEIAERYLRRKGIGTFGVECVAIADRSAEYLNTGDTYSLTILREDNSDSFRESTSAFEVTTWGDWYESAEREHEEDTDTIRCGYCGEFTPLCDKAMAEPAGARHSWNETVCESCGHYVDGSN